MSRVTKHHLAPKSKGGIDTVELCSTCHSTLHRFYTNRTLARDLASIEALHQNDEIQRYLAWVRKQPDRKIRVRTRRSRR